MTDDLKDLYDAVVIGGGPAGLTAALYLARARYRVLVVEKEKFGGQITITADVVNYPGVERGSGEAITKAMRQQAINFGAEFRLAEVTSIELADDIKVVHTTAGDVRAFGLILATGAKPRTVGFAGEADFMGRGVAYCATCDGEFFTGLDVLVVGGGLAAAEESGFLTKYARHVTMLVRGPALDVPKSALEAVEANPKITVNYNTTLDEVTGDTALRTARYRNTATGEVTNYTPPEGDTFGVFVFAGYVPSTEVVKGLVELDQRGYIVTDPATMATAVPGVYAAGDVRPKPLRQMVTATADGATAATELERHIASMHTKTGLVPQPPVRELDPQATSQAPEASVSGATVSASSGFFTDDIRSQLAGLFPRFENSLTLRAVLDAQPISSEVNSFVTELAGMSGGKLTADVVDGAAASALGGLTPRIDLLKDGVDTGISFGGVPGGHEFNSFVLGLYNAAGPGQPLDDATRARIAAIDKPVDIRILVALSCTMCPDTVLSSQRIAALNQKVTARAYDLAHFPALKEQYRVMSVPCILIDDQEPHFGKKNIAQMLDLLGV